MGYYSKVVIGLSEEANQFLQKELDILKADGMKKDVWEEVEHLFNVRFQKGRYNKAYIYRMDWVKWYKTFSEVNWIENFLSSLDLEEFRFLRIGEDSGDVEFYGENEDASFEPVTDVVFY